MYGYNVRQSLQPRGLGAKFIILVIQTSIYYEHFPRKH